ncbi:hypothetical protein RSAG8_12974, partial [Rhizoctonia solani AG-8 WAC10335]
MLFQKINNYKSCRSSLIQYNRNRNRKLYPFLHQPPPPNPPPSHPPHPHSPPRLANATPIWGVTLACPSPTDPPFVRPAPGLVEFRPRNTKACWATKTIVCFG